VLLAVNTDEVGWDINNLRKRTEWEGEQGEGDRGWTDLLADTNVLLADENTSVVNALKERGEGQNV
jgi:hypothetical protein